MIHSNQTYCFTEAILKLSAYVLFALAVLVWKSTFLCFDFVKGQTNAESYQMLAFSSGFSRNLLKKNPKNRNTIHKKPFSKAKRPFYASKDSQNQRFPLQPAPPKVIPSPKTSHPPAQLSMRLPHDCASVHAHDCASVHIADHGVRYVHALWRGVGEL